MGSTKMSNLFYPRCPGSIVGPPVGENIDFHGIFLVIISNIMSKAEISCQNCILNLLFFYFVVENHAASVEIFSSK